jgi:hypothetical protein
MQKRLVCSRLVRFNKPEERKGRPFDILEIYTSIVEGCCSRFYPPI